MSDWAHKERYRQYVGDLPGALFWGVVQEHLACPFSHQSYVGG